MCNSKNEIVDMLSIMSDLFITFESKKKRLFEVLVENEEYSYDALLLLFLMVAIERIFSVFLCYRFTYGDNRFPVEEYLSYNTGVLN